MDYKVTRIKLFYIHSHNHGNLMIACAFIKYFSELMKKNGNTNIEFYLDVLDDEELTRVKKCIPNNLRVYREDLYDKKRRGIVGKLTKLLFIPKEISFNKKFYDLCVVLGGDCISQYYSKQVFISDMIKFKHISRKKEMFLLGQTMGPFSGYAKLIINNCLKNCKIYLRSRDNYEYIKNNFKLKYVFEARDLAFLDIPFQNENTHEVIDKYVKDKEYVTIIASGLNQQYTDNTENYVNEYINIIKDIIDNRKYEVLLMAHVIHVSDSNDKLIINKILEKIDNKYKNHIMVINELIPPYEARILLGHGQYTITGRMHAAVSSINMNVIPICLSYSIKYKGVIGDDFNLNEYILQCRGDEFWNGKQISEKIKEIENKLQENKSSIINNMIDKIKKVQEMSLRQIVDVVNVSCKEK